MSEQMIRNEYGEVVHLSRPAPAVRGAAGTGGAPRRVAEEFLRDNLERMGLGGSALRAAGATTTGGEPDGLEIHLAGERDVDGSKLLVYEQTVLGLPVFGARMGLHVDLTAGAVTSAQSSLHGSVEVENPEQKGADSPGALSDEALRDLLGIDLPRLGDGRIERQVVYRFEPGQRVEATDDAGGGFAGPAPPPPDLPPLPPRFAKGRHYVVDEVLFRAARRPDEDPVRWRALVEPETRAVLYLRALVAEAG